jgi:AcrR family transcriptional regulator
MDRTVKRRAYDNTRRRELTRATRADVVAAAQRLFVADGFPATTVESIAEASQTPVATVYRLFGSKRSILLAVLDVAFGGDDEPVPFHQRPAVRAALAEPDPGKLLDAFARLCRELLDRSAAIQHVLAGAAAADPDAAAVLATSREQRYTGQSRIARALADRHALPDGMTRTKAADLIYTLMSPELHRILTVERGWSPSRYETWLATTLRAQLLG